MDRRRRPARQRRPHSGPRRSLRHSLPGEESGFRGPGISTSGEASSGAPSGRSASCFAKRPPGSSRSSGPGSSFIRGTMPGAASSKPGCTGRGAWGSASRGAVACGNSISARPSSMSCLARIQCSWSRPSGWPSASQMACATRAMSSLAGVPAGTLTSSSSRLEISSATRTGRQGSAGVKKRGGQPREPPRFAALPHSIGFPHVTGMTAPEI